MGAAMQEGGRMRDGVPRALLLAFAASILLHVALFVVLPRVRELSALIPPPPQPLIAHLVGLPAERIERLSLRANTGLSVIDFRHARPQLTMLNDARHLEDGWTS